MAPARPGAWLWLTATCWRRLTEWAADVSDQLHLEVLDRLGELGRRVCDGSGLPLTAAVTAANVPT
jgi:hypothetical protein